MATLTKGTLVTIIGEAVLQERLIHLLKQLGVLRLHLAARKRRAVMQAVWATSQAITPTSKSKHRQHYGFLISCSKP
jgi:hypothetical protein